MGKSRGKCFDFSQEVKEKLQRSDKFIAVNAFSSITHSAVQLFSAERHIKMWRRRKKSRKFERIKSVNPCPTSRSGG